MTLYEFLKFPFFAFWFIDSSLSNAFLNISNIVVQVAVPQDFWIFSFLVG